MIGDEKCEIICFSGGMFFVWNTWGISDIVGGCQCFPNNAASSCQSFWNTWSGNAPFVSCRYFWIMLHQFVNIFGIHGVSVTLLLI